MKKILSIIITIMLFSTTCISASADDEISVYLDAKKIEFDVKPQIINERTMVPIRAIFEEMGAVVEWDQSTSTAISTKGDTIVKMTVNSMDMYVNNQLVKMDTSPVVIDGRTLAPARYVAEAFGADVQWNQQNSTVIITSKVAVKYYYDATNEVNQIKGFISRGLYLEAIQVCQETLAWHDLSESDKSLINGLKTNAENLYNTYLYNLEQNKTANNGTIADYKNAKDFESALNSGKIVINKTVTFYVDAFVPNSAFGYNLQAGDHLNFCSAKDPKVRGGDTITVKVKEVFSFLGSYIISYEILQ